ncbi:uncharacterized protein C8R40DRAFT_1112976, partial [Lentinula edodes]|uniref:uncharacterized protein n=1 Tax=Lentinula edodes TaxID=5353 RepID=UPI001E8EA1A9
KLDPEADKKMKSLWSKDSDPHYFSSCKISAVALIKMVGRCSSVISKKLRKVVGTSLVILDSFALPVRGTETRVNAGAETTEYMVAYHQCSQSAGRPEDLVDWYHSHPGNGRWLSGIDVSTRLNDQKHTDPFVAVVVDPNRTMTAGKVDIGAFRMYLEDYTPENVASSEYQSIPLSQIEGFGIHANQYYPLETQLLDLPWNSYWVNTLIDLNQELYKHPPVSAKDSKDVIESSKEEKKENELAKTRHGLIVIFSIRPGSGQADTSQIGESMNIG